MSGLSFSPENVLRGEDGRWYFEGVDVTDLPVGWKCPDCGLRYKETIGARTDRGAGCPDCAPPETDWEVRREVVLDPDGGTGVETVAVDRAAMARFRAGTSAQFSDGR